MATSTIKGGIVSFVGSRASGITGSCIGTYNKRTGLVTISWVATASAAITTTTTLFTIPSKYRPRSEAEGTVFGANASGSFSAGSCKVGTDGNLMQRVSNNRTAFMGMVQYTI